MRSGVCGWSAEDLGDGAGLALFQSLNLLKEGDEGLRIVAGAVHVLHAQVVGLRLELAGELQEGNRECRSERLRRCRSRSSRR